MSRPQRIEFAGACYHVMARGNARERIYWDDEDRQRFLDGLSRVCGRFDWILQEIRGQVLFCHMRRRTQVPHFANPNRSISDQARVLNQRLAESLRQKNPNLCSVTPSVHRSFK
jgi:hypothetical protein